MKMGKSKRIYVLIDDKETKIIPDSSFSLDAQIRAVLEKHFPQENSTENTTDAL